MKHALFLLSLLAVLPVSGKSKLLDIHIDSAQYNPKNNALELEISHSGGCSTFDKYGLEVEGCSKTSPVTCRDVRVLYETDNSCEALISEKIILPLEKVGIYDKYYSSASFIIRGDDGSKAQVQLPVILEGRKYCRTILSSGLFGQPKGKREHCLTFEHGKLRDNSSTFFGNPPTVSDYKYSNEVIYILDVTNKWVPQYFYEEGNKITHYKVKEQVFTEKLQ